MHRRSSGFLFSNIAIVGLLAMVGSATALAGGDAVTPSPSLLQQLSDDTQKVYEHVRGGMIWVQLPTPQWLEQSNDQEQLLRKWGAQLDLAVRDMIRREQEQIRTQAYRQVGAVTTTKRSAKTTVIVDDNQTIVIGGLISNDSNEAKTSVPCLGNIPIFGWAFKQSSISKRKTNLLIFMTPHIITSQEDIDRVTTHERQRLEQAPAIEEQLRQGQPQDNLELLLN